MMSSNKRSISIFGLLYTYYIGLLPVLMIYKLPFVNFGLGVLLALIFLPYVFFSAFNKTNNKFFSIQSFLIVLFLLYYAYCVSSDFNVSTLLIVVAIHVLFAPKSLYFVKFLKIVKGCVLISSVIIIFQWLIYTLFGVFIPFIIDDYILEAFKGTSGMSEESAGFYRISGLFLEPSHYSKYAIVGLAFFLFESTLNKRVFMKAIIVTIGILLSTSGIGLVGALGIWAYYFVFKDNLIVKQKSKIARVFYLLILGSFILLTLFYASNSFHHSVIRILGLSDDYNAIEGRTLYSESYLALLGDSDWLLGIGTFEVEKYLVGYVTLLLHSGIVGLSLIIITSIAFLFNNRTAIKLNIIFFVILLFYSNIVGGLYLLFYFVMFNNKYIYEKK